jgi:hypothetical protein
MPRPNGNENPNIHNQGTNSSGNDYTNYNNGAYRYSNKTPEGNTSSSYYNNNGHGFYRKNGEVKLKIKIGKSFLNKIISITTGPEGYSFHENQNQGFRSYQSNGKKE